MTHSSPRLRQLPSTPASLDWGRLSLDELKAAMLKQHHSNIPLLLIAPSVEHAKQIETMLSPDVEVSLFPDWETLSYDLFAPAPEIVSRRLKLLTQLPTRKNGIIVIAAHTLMLLLPPRRAIEAHFYHYQLNTKFDRNAEQSRFESAGYTRVHTVYEPGEYAFRGEVIDLFPLGTRAPIRMNCFDDEIESIHQFDPSTQRRTQALQTFSLLPAHEYPLDQGSIDHFRSQWYAHFSDAPETAFFQSIMAQKSTPGAEYFLSFFYPALSSLFDFLPTQTRIIDCGSSAIASAFQNLTDRYAADRAMGRPIPPPNDIALDTHRLKVLLSAYPVAHCELIFAEQPDARTIEKLPKRKSANSAVAAGMNPAELAQLEIGMPIVHEHYGVGRYQGMVQMEVGGGQNEFLLITYLNDDKLYVPISHLKCVSRYLSGPDNDAPLDRLGSSRWKQRIEKAKKHAFDIAADLLKAYARREAIKRPPYTLDETEYAQFVSHFPFKETEDQEKAIHDVISALKGEQYIDRLICGDVGFGKTEIAMRAAYVVAANGQQVAILAPTTLLAEQHGRNFKERFEDFPYRIEVMTRFRTPKQQTEIAEALASGAIDILIGTHKILSKTIEFKSLGMLIVDEEHRFGVRHKEQLRQLKNTVDVLTMTATPIPRTLNLSMSGLRDLSIIHTPPPGRLPIETIVIEDNPLAIRDGIQRELHRGGQVFYLHNQVKSIQAVANRLQAQLPSARIGIGHGQMPERQLETVMQAFYAHHLDILVCTTIIESGIDIANANTLIVDRADKFGLAELHQLRGRVGRSKAQAYAYLLIPEEDHMTQDAVLRIEAIKRTGGLGAGFNLAMEDLEIRGAGQLLGKEQSGEMHDVGYSLFQSMLKQAIAQLKAGNLDPEHTAFTQPIELELKISALIPDQYVTDIPTRLTLYERLGQCQNEDEVFDFSEELIDRFGALPTPAQHLLRLRTLELKALALKLTAIQRHQADIQFLFKEDAKIDFAGMISTVRAQPERYALSPRGLKRLGCPPEPEAILDSVDNTLMMLEGRDHD